MKRPFESKGQWQAKLSRMKNNAQKSARARGFTEDFRSGLELQIGIFLKHINVSYEFENETIPYVTEPKQHKYTPDFKIRTVSGRVIYIESKGRFEKADRDKHLYVKKQHPELDIRFVFSNPYTWDRAAKTRSYAKWADKHGFKWCGKVNMQKTLKAWSLE